MAMCWILWPTKIGLSHVIVSDILDSDHLAIVFHILGHATTKKLSDPLEKFTDWERFQNLVYSLISPRIEINSGAEADKAVFEFTASIASAYRPTTSKIKLSELKRYSRFRYVAKTQEEVKETVARSQGSNV
jgi:hypothetical protein